MLLRHADGAIDPAAFSHLRRSFSRPDAIKRVRRCPASAVLSPAEAPSTARETLK